MKKGWIYTAFLFIGGFISMLIAYLTKRTIVVKVNKEENVSIKKPKIKGDNSNIDNTVSLIKKTNRKTNKKERKKRRNKK